MMLTEVQTHNAIFISMNFEMTDQVQFYTIENGIFTDPLAENWNYSMSEFGIHKFELLFSEPFVNF